MSESQITPRTPVGMDSKGVQLRSMEDAFRFSTAIVKSGLAPRGLDTPEKVLVAVQTALEAGLTPLAGLRSIYVVGGMPAWYGKAAKALILASGRCRDWSQGIDGTGDARVAWVKSVRDGIPGEKKTEFSVADAKRMRLWSKTGPWTDDPERMLLWRAIGRHAADWYQDVLMGLPLAEEVMDYEAATDTVQAIRPAPSASDPLLDAARSIHEPSDGVGEEPDAHLSDERGLFTD